MKKIGFLLSGAGVFDGTEIHEATLSLLAIDQQGWQVVGIAPNIMQHDVVDHTTQQVQVAQKRNVLQEAARITRGNIQDIAQLTPQAIESLDALVIPGGFGAAKNLSHWAFLGHEGAVLDEVKNLILYFVQHKKPIVALCIAPVLIAKSLEGSNYIPTLTLGGSENAEQQMQKTGAKMGTHNADNLVIDEANKIICAPCYMNDVTISSIFNQTQAAIHALADWLK